MEREVSCALYLFSSRKNVMDLNDHESSVCFVSYGSGDLDFDMKLMCPREKGRRMKIRECASHSFDRRVAWVWWTEEFVLISDPNPSWSWWFFSLIVRYYMCDSIYLSKTEAKKCQTRRSKKNFASQLEDNRVLIFIIMFFFFPVKILLISSFWLAIE